MNTTQANTAWGEVHMFIAETNSTETFPADLLTMDEIGVVKDGTTTIETTDGEVLELKREGGILYDKLEKESTFQINCTLIDIPEETAEKLWDMDKTGGKIRVKSTMSGKKWAVGFAAVKVPGSRTFEVPKSTIKMTPSYSSSEGWSCAVAISVLQSDITGVTFQFGKVA